MNSHKDDILKQKQSVLTFTFDQQNDKLLIKAQSQGITYCGFLEPNPLLPFDKVKKVLAAKNYQLTSITAHQMEITIGGMIDLQLKSQDELTLQFLKDTIQKLTTAVQAGFQKNNLLQQKLSNIESSIQLIMKEHPQKVQSIETSIQLMQIKHQAQILAVKTLQENQAESQNLINTNLQNSVEELREKFEVKSKQQDELITKLQEEIQTLKQQNQKQKENILDQVRQISLIDNAHILFKNEVQTSAQLERQKVVDLNTQLTQFKAQLDQINVNTISKCLTYEPGFFHYSKVICSDGEKNNIRKFFNKTIKNTKLLYRASDHGFCVKKFHEKCDGIANTLTVILTDSDRKIGGFTPLKWSSPQKQEHIADKSRESFTFSLTNNDKFVLQQFYQGWAISNSCTEGPAFGNGYDIVVGDKRYGYANIGSVYTNYSYMRGESKAWERFSGSSSSYQFMASEWQVWGMEFA